MYLAVSAARMPVADRAIQGLPPRVSDGDIARELEALTRFTSEHMARLVDVGSRGTARRAWCWNAIRGSLADLLRADDRLTAGEAVTILAPLAQLVAAAHSAGVAHGAFGRRRVLFSARGAPVLIGWGRASSVRGGVNGGRTGAARRGDTRSDAAAQDGRRGARRGDGDAAVQRGRNRAGWMARRQTPTGFPRSSPTGCSRSPSHGPCRWRARAPRRWSPRAVPVGEPKPVHDGAASALRRGSRRCRCRTGCATPARGGFAASRPLAGRRRCARFADHSGSPPAARHSPWSRDCCSCRPTVMPAKTLRRARIREPGSRSPT